MHELEVMTDRELADIGLTRGAIPHVFDAPMSGACGTGQQRSRAASGGASQGQRRPGIFPEDALQPRPVPARRRQWPRAWVSRGPAGITVPAGQLFGHAARCRHPVQRQPSRRAGSGQMCACNRARPYHDSGHEFRLGAARGARFLRSRKRDTAGGLGRGRRKSAPLRLAGGLIRRTMGRAAQPRVTGPTRPLTACGVVRKRAPPRV